MQINSDRINDGFVSKHYYLKNFSAADHFVPLIEDGKLARRDSQQQVTERTDRDETAEAHRGLETRAIFLVSSLSTLTAGSEGAQHTFSPRRQAKVHNREQIES